MKTTRRGFFAALCAVPIAAKAAAELPVSGIAIARRARPCLSINRIPEAGMIARLLIARERGRQSAEAWMRCEFERDEDLKFLSGAQWDA